MNFLLWCCFMTSIYASYNWPLSRTKFILMLPSYSKDKLFSLQLWWNSWWWTNNSSYNLLIIKVWETWNLINWKSPWIASFPLSFPLRSILGESKHNFLASTETASEQQDARGELFPTVVDSLVHRKFLWNKPLWNDQLHIQKHISSSKVDVKLCRRKNEYIYIHITKYICLCVF